MPPLKVVWFDFGFTLWDEQRAWTQWSELLGVPALELFAVLGSVIERGEHHLRAFEIFRRGIDLTRERQMRRNSAQDELRRHRVLLDERQYRTGVAGNHFADFANTLRRMNLPLDLIGSSEKWGVEKPSPDFFAQIVRMSRVLPAKIAYVGDRLDNDVLPSKAAGMVGLSASRPMGIDSLSAS